MIQRPLYIVTELSNDGGDRGSSQAWYFFGILYVSFVVSFRARSRLCCVQAKCVCFDDAERDLLQAVFTTTQNGTGPYRDELTVYKDYVMIEQLAQNANNELAQMFPTSWIIRSIRKVMVRLGKTGNNSCQGKITKKKKPGNRKP